MREYLQQTWQQKLGITVELNAMNDYTLFAAEQEAGNYDVYQNYCACDMMIRISCLKHSMHIPLICLQVATTIRNLMLQLINPKKQLMMKDVLEAYKEAEQILIDDSAFIPVYYTTKEYFLKPWVKDFRWSSYGASMEFYITYIEGRNK